MFAGAVAAEGAVGRGVIGEAVGGGVLDGIDMPGIEWFMPPIGMPDPDALRRPPNSCAAAGLAIIASVSNIHGIRKVVAIPCIVDSSPAYSFAGNGFR